ncbi:MAG: glycosyltransferase family 2 protein [bacterium]|nr:glycosyltransferase family 2 protein [bacterium]
MKNFSIIVPVYNEPEYIIQCLKKIDELDYPKQNYEVIIINDASTDQTKTKIKNFIKTRKHFKIRTNPKNLGRIKSRQRGAEKSKFDNLLFVDSRAEISSDTLKYLSSQNEKIIIPSNIEYNKTKSGLDLFFNNIKGRIYGAGEAQTEATIRITKNNFDKFSKGTTACFFEKEVFLRSSRSLKDPSKNSSDDIKLLEKSLEFTKHISSDKNFRIKYNSRDNFIKALRHTFNRGPKFVDYYFKTGKKFFPHLISIYLLTLINIFFLLKPIIFLYEIAILAILLVGWSLQLSKTVREFFTCLYLIPIIGTAFYLGIIKGLILKLPHFSR